MIVMKNVGLREERKDERCKEEKERGGTENMNNKKWEKRRARFIR